MALRLNMTFITVFLALSVTGQLISVNNTVLSKFGQQRLFFPIYVGLYLLKIIFFRQVIK